MANTLELIALGAPCTTRSYLKKASASLAEMSRPLPFEDAHMDPVPFPIDTRIDDVERPIQAEGDDRVLVGPNITVLLRGDVGTDGIRLHCLFGLGVPCTISRR